MESVMSSRHNFSKRPAIPYRISRNQVLVSIQTDHSTSDAYFWCLLRVTPESDCTIDFMFSVINLKSVPAGCSGITRQDKQKNKAVLKEGAAAPVETEEEEEYVQNVGAQGTNRRRSTRDK